jgi:hypothetical protein
MSIGRGGVSENRLCYPLVQGRSTIEVSGHLMVISVVCSEKVSERPVYDLESEYGNDRNATEVGHQIQVVIGEHRTRIAIPVTYLGRLR